MFSSAYKYSFKDMAEPDFLYIYSSFYKKLIELNLNYESKELSEKFNDDVKRLGRDISAAGFLYRNGTHFASKASYGGHFILRNRVNKEAFRYSDLTTEEFSETIKNTIKEKNFGGESVAKSNPNKIEIGNSESFTIGGTKTIIVFNLSQDFT